MPGLAVGDGTAYRDHPAAVVTRAGAGAGQLGVQFEHRSGRTEEFIGAMRSLWTSDPSSSTGEHAVFQHVRSYPKPTARDGRIPIIVGGGGPIGARRAGCLGDGYYPFHTTLDDLPALLERKAAVEADRDPEAVEVARLFDTTTPVALAAIDRLSEELIWAGLVVTATRGAFS